MASSGGLKSSTAREWREKYPDLPSLKLARIMYKENDLLFKNVDDARSSLRYIEGKVGKKRPANKAFVKEEARPYNPYKLPDSDEAKYEPFVLSGHKKVGVICDLHVPYHNIESLTSTINTFKKEKIDALLLNGDTIDAHGLSRFVRDPKKRNFAGELEIFKQVFDVLEKQLKCKIYFKLGNHDERYEQFLYQKAGELSGIDEFKFENIIKARARGIEVIGDKRIIKMNALNAIHGHEYVGGAIAPVNIARGLYMKGKVNAFQGHNHATSEHTESDMNGGITTTWSVGCLCELHPAYMPLNKWNHGFAWVELDQNKIDFEFHNKRIGRDGKVL